MGSVFLVFLFVFFSSPPGHKATDPRPKQDGPPTGARISKLDVNGLGKDQTKEQLTGDESNDRIICNGWEDNTKLKAKDCTMSAGGKKFHCCYCRCGCDDKGNSVGGAGFEKVAVSAAAGASSGSSTSSDAATAPKTDDFSDIQVFLEISNLEPSRSSRPKIFRAENNGASLIYRPTLASVAGVGKCHCENCFEETKKSPGSAKGEGTGTAAGTALFLERSTSAGLTHLRSVGTRRNTRAHLRHREWCGGRVGSSIISVEGRDSIGAPKRTIEQVSPTEDETRGSDPSAQVASRLDQINGILLKEVAFIGWAGATSDSTAKGRGEGGVT